jgi:diketogulonate reductase-like aldo/keto reductase
MPKTPSVKLHNGVEMPLLGFGVYQITDLKQCEESVYDALMAGYRSIDTAAVYRNEEAVGRAIKRSGIPREEIFVTTKAWVQDVNYDDVKRAFQTSLDKLQLDYLDLYLIHQPFNDYYGAWRGMEELYEAGKIKAIGVSNFASDRLVDLILNNKIAPMVNQIETHPFDQQIAARKVMDEYGVRHESWAPFAEGRQNLFTNETLKRMAEYHKKSVAQVVLRWLFQREIVAIPKSTHKERIIENFDIFDFELSAEDMEAIRAMDEQKALFVVHEDPEFVKQINSRKIHN